MKFAEFYHLSTGYIEGSLPPKFNNANRKPIPACGSDSILYIDGRYGNDRAAHEARETCRKRGFVGFTLNAGSSLSDSRVIRQLEVI